MQLCQRAAQRIAVHAKFRRGLALVATMVCEDLKYVALFELPYSIGVRNPSRVHLGNQGIQFALQGATSLACQYETKSTVDHSMPIDPAGRVVVEIERAARHQVLKVFRYEEGYIMRHCK
jgi:hypothetical protein